MPKIAISPDELSAALTEWYRLFHNEPDKFFSDQGRLAPHPDTYGDKVAPHIIEILTQLRGEDIYLFEGHQNMAEPLTVTHECKANSKVSFFKKFL